MAIGIFRNLLAVLVNPQVPTLADRCGGMDPVVDLPEIVGPLASVGPPDPDFPGGLGSTTDIGKQNIVVAGGMAKINDATPVLSLVILDPDRNGECTAKLKRGNQHVLVVLVVGVEVQGAIDLAALPLTAIKVDELGVMLTQGVPGDGSLLIVKGPPTQHPVHGQGKVAGDKEFAIHNIDSRRTGILILIVQKYRHRVYPGKGYDRGNGIRQLDQTGNLVRLVSLGVSVIIGHKILSGTGTIR